MRSYCAWASPACASRSPSTALAWTLSRPRRWRRTPFTAPVSIALDGLRDFSKHYAEEAERLACETSDVARWAELRQIAEICRRVPEHPARTFREALQAVHLTTFSLCVGQQMLLFQLGRPDRYLLPYYQRDVAEGRLSEEEAQELIDCLCLMLCVYTPRSLAVGFMIGGRDGSGRDISNDLTRLFLESIAHTRLSYPGIGLCWNEDTPVEITERACELLAEGYTHPAIFNDQVITAGMMQAGLPPAEACLFQHSTCVEITPVASSNVYVASPYINLVQLLHDLLQVQPLSESAQRTREGLSGGAAPDSPAPAPSFASFDALLAAYEAHLAEVLRLGVLDENTCQMTRYYHGGWPLLSCFVNDCLAKGTDIDQGGARHNWIEPSFVGLSNLVDALTAIRQFVYEEKRLELGELARAMRDDYAGREDLRLMLLHQAPKYGNDDDAVDALAVRLTETIVRECRRYRTYLGGDYHPGLFLLDHARAPRLGHGGLRRRAPRPGRPGRWIRPGAGARAPGPDRGNTLLDQVEPRAHARRDRRQPQIHALGPQGDLSLQPAQPGGDLPAPRGVRDPGQRGGQEYPARRAGAPGAIPRPGGAHRGL